MTLKLSPRILELEPSDIAIREQSWNTYHHDDPVSMVHGQELHLLPKDAYSSILYVFRRQHVGLLLALARFNLDGAAGEENVAIDVGANIGYFSAALALRGDVDNVLAFEPNSACFEVLELNAKRYTKVFPRRIALQGSEEETEAWLDSEPSRSAWGAIRFGSSVGNHFAERVRCSTLDVWAQSEEKLHSSSLALVKIDVEGNEAEVLRGGSELLSSHRPIIVCELSENETRREETIRQLQQTVVSSGSLSTAKYWTFDESGFLHQTDPLDLMREPANDVILSLQDIQVRQ